MRYRFAWFVWAILAALLAVPTLQGHVPRTEAAGTTYEDAFHIDEFDKSWVFYGALQAGEQRIYRIEAQEGDSLYAVLQTPPGASAVPRMSIVGLGWNETAPPDAPPGLTARHLPMHIELGFEPFTPTALRTTAEIETSLPAGIHYLVLTSEDAAPYSLGLGKREAFTPFEWLAIPADRIQIHDWAGQPIVLAFLGELVAIVGVGALAVYQKETRPHALLRWTATALFAGSGMTVMLQTFIGLGWSGWSNGAIVALVLAAINGLVAWGAWRTTAAHSRRNRILAGGLSVVGLATWSGLYIGPLALIAWLAWPTTRSQP